MTEAQTALSHRAVACKGWRWMAGMRAVGRRNLPAAWFRLEESTPSLTGEWSGALPDLTDPATLGCLLALVRESEGCAVITSPDYDEDETGCQGLNVTGWRAIETVRWMPVGEGATEAEALVAALEGAP